MTTYTGLTVATTLILYCLPSRNVKILPRGFNMHAVWFGRILITAAVLAAVVAASNTKAAK